MVFGNSLFLWGLLAVPLPVIIHLFFKRHKTKVAFSTIRFFRPHERLFAYRRRLRELLLLLLRTLALLALALALARPVWQRVAWSLTARTDAVIVFDDTLSMGRQNATGHSAFEQARQLADAVIESLSNGDGIGLVYVSGRPGVPLDRTQQKVVAALNDAELTAATGSYVGALQRAVHLILQSSSPNREIYLVSDFQTSQLPATPFAFPDMERVRLFALGTGGTEENVAVRPLPLSTRPKVVDQLLRVPVRLENLGREDRRVEVRLHVDGETVATRFVRLRGNDSYQDDFEYVPTRPGFLSGSVVVDDSGLDLDNRAYFCAEVREHTAVLLLRRDVYSRADPFFFLRSALAPPTQPHLNGFDVQDQYVQTVTGHELRRYAVVVLADPNDLPPPAAQALTDYVQAGGAIVCFGGSQVGPDSLNSLSLPALRGLYGSKQNSEAVGLRFAGPFAGFNDSLDLALVHWRRRHQLQLPPDTQVLASVAGTPMLVERRFGDGRWLTFGCSARRDYSNWPELKSFPISMIHLFDYAGTFPQDVIRLQCGQRVAVPADEDSVQIADQSGQVHDLVINGDSATYAATWRPGVLKVRGSRIKAVAVNAAADESKLEMRKPAAAVARITTAPVHVLRSDAELPSQIRNYRRGNDLSGVLLFAVLLFLGGESMLGYGPRFFRRRRTDAGEAIRT